MVTLLFHNATCFIVLYEFPCLGPITPFFGIVFKTFAINEDGKNNQCEMSDYTIQVPLYGHD